MAKTSFWMILVIISLSSCHASKIDIEELKAVVQQRFVDLMKTQLPSILKTMIPQKPLNKQGVVDEINPDLNSTVITKALDNLKYIFPDKIPLIPYAVAEPIPAYNMLLYFAELGSSFTNLTNFKSEATVHNTESSVSITTNLHINSSSMDGHYELDISNADIHLFGDGDYSILSQGTDYAVSTEIDVFRDYSFRMTHFFMNVTVNSIKLNLSNLLNGDQSVRPVIDFLEENLPRVISDVNDMMRTEINNTVVQLTNNYLANIFSWDEIVWIIQSAAQYH